MFRAISDAFVFSDVYMAYWKPKPANVGKVYNLNIYFED